MSQDSFARIRGPSSVLAAAFLIPALLVFAQSGAVIGSGSAADDENILALIDIERMMATVEALQDFGSREFHLESSRQAAAFLYESFDEIGLSVQSQHFSVGEADVSNIVATLHGTDDEAGTYLFGAHYDSENRDAHNLSSAENLTAPGADDDASGVAVVLEIARVLAGSDFPSTVKFVMFGAEEMGYDDSGGLKGSEHFVANEVATGRSYSGTAILDMIGYRAGETNRASLVLEEPGDAFAASVMRAVDRFGIDLELAVLIAPTITYSDHSSFWEAGFPSMLVIEQLDDVRHFPVNPNYHTSSDTVDTLSQGQVLAVAQALLGGLLLTDDGDGGRALIFGTALMSATIVSVALFMYIRRNARKDR